MIGLCQMRYQADLYYNCTICTVTLDYKALTMLMTKRDDDSFKLDDSFGKLSGLKVHKLILPSGKGLHGLFYHKQSDMWWPAIL